MIEAAGLMKDNTIQVVDHGASITVLKNGLYRVTADPAAVAVLEGKADVRLGERKLLLGKGHEALLAGDLKPQKFDTKKEDDLYAWSNVRSEYEAAASYQAAKDLSATNPGNAWVAGSNGWYGPGWYWNNGFSSWAWLPGNGAFFSPFGYGFYGMGYLPYAPVIVAPVYRTASLNNGQWVGHGTNATVPVNAVNPHAVGALASSPWANHVARNQAAAAFAESGFRTATGAPAPVFEHAGMHASPSGAATGGAHPNFSGMHAAPSGGATSAGAMSRGGGGGHR
jgi:hypothetical protein